MKISELAKINSIADGSQFQRIKFSLLEKDEIYQVRSIKKIHTSFGFGIVLNLVQNDDAIYETYLPARMIAILTEQAIEKLQNFAMMDKLKIHCLGNNNFKFLNE